MTMQEAVAPSERAGSPLPTGKMLAIIAAAAVVGTLIVFGAILPAEFNQDPLGIGRLTGLDRLAPPPESTLEETATTTPLARDYPTGFRSDTLEIPLAALGSRGRSIEYKVLMKKDAALIYQWSVPGVATPAEFYSDLHGETPAPNGEMIVATYRQAEGASANGFMIAAFDGVHGWYLQNRSANPVVVTLKISGFYELIPSTR